MKKKLLVCLVSSFFLFLLVSCKSNIVDLKYLNGQIALVASGKNQLKIKDENKTSYNSVSSDIIISFEVFNINLEHANLLIVNDYEILLDDLQITRNAFVKNEITILGANVIDGKLDLSFKTGYDSFNNLDMFSIRNVFIKINENEFWSDAYSKDDYLNEEFNIGRNDLNPKIRYDYKSKRDFSFTIPSKELDCQAILIDNTEEEINYSQNNKDLRIDNKAYLDVSVNIDDKDNINDTHKLAISTSGEIASLQTFMDGLLIPNDLQLSKNAWASGIHKLRVVAINKFGFVLEKNLEFTLGGVSQNSSTLNYKMYDPGLANSLTNDITNLGKEVTGNHYLSGFSEIPHLNYVITPNEDLTFLWNGTVPNNRTVFMQIYNANTKIFETVSTSLSNGGVTSVGFEVTDTAKYLSGGKLYVRVGNMNLVKEKHITAQIFHLSDIQYMTQRSAVNIGSTISKEYRKSLNDLADFLIKQDHETTYSLLTGDIVQSLKNVDAEWEAAMEEFFNPILASPVRIGVSSGNHDVGGISENSVNGGNALDDELYYSYFSANVGENVFKDRGYYGGSYKDNRSHYDLITLGGHEFLFLYLGWGSSIKGINVSEQDINYAKGVLESYPNKTVVIGTHNYMATTNTRNATGEFVFNHLVKKYDNIKMVLSGHINSTSKKIDYIDDNNDGITDRQVLQLLTNFQEEENLFGATFIRLIGLDFVNSQMVLDLYSPYMKANEIIVSSTSNHANTINDNTRFTYAFDLNNLGFGMKSDLLK